MLHLQKYLRSGKTLSDLTDNLGIKTYHHPILPLVGFKYSQIDSPKMNPIVQECRGIVLEEHSWDVVAKPFNRFYNAGEDLERAKLFNWENFTTTTKEDGSLIILYNYNGRWHVNTSGSFGLGECNFSGRSWAELFWETSGIDQGCLDNTLTYIFEMWTPFNKVVRIYPKPFVSLLSVFVNDAENPYELSEYAGGITGWAKLIGVSRPEQHYFTSMDDITSFLRTKSATDKTFEGVVIRDDANIRFKIKSDTYLAIHHLVDNGNLFNPKRLVPLVLAGESSEILAYHPEVKESMERVQADLDREFRDLVAIGAQAFTMETQKEFAQEAMKSKFSHILFEKKKCPEKTFVELWRDSADLIVKKLYS